jgi:acyl-CoA reductase-like NAD-dependent aldehyde dehydrogenase
MCLGAERIFVFEGIYDEFIDRVTDITMRLRQGAPLSGKLADVGAMTMPAQVDIVDELVQDAVAKGAKVRCGGDRAKPAKGRSRQFYQPTVLSGVTPEMRIFDEECFGPVMSVVKVKNEEEAVRLANQSEYGLSSTVYTKDHVRGRRIGEQLRAGSTCINDWAVMYMANDLPFGGIDGSGFGRLNGREGLRACCNEKAVIEDRFPIHRPIKLFPGKRGDYEVTRAAVRLMYRKGLSNKLEDLKELGRAWWDRRYY